MAWSCHYATGCFVAFLGDTSTLKSGWNLKKIFCCPALKLFHCLPLWKTVLFVSSRAFPLSTYVENSDATWKKATKCNKLVIPTGALVKYALFGMCDLKIKSWTDSTPDTLAHGVINYFNLLPVASESLNFLGWKLY